MEQSKERPVFTEHPPMSKIIRAEATKFPVLDQAQPESAKKLYDAFHDNTDDTVERYDNKRFSVCGNYLIITTALGVILKNCELIN